MNYKEASSQHEYLSYDDILMDVLNENHLYFDFQDRDVQKNFEKICDFLLNSYLPKSVFNLSINVPIYFQVYKNNSMYYYPGTPERIRYILECLKKKNFDEIQDLDRTIWNYETTENLEYTPVQGFGIYIYPSAGIRYNNSRGGDFFNYLILSNAPVKIIEQLKRYQIFKSIVNSKGEGISELEDCCFVYALKMTGEFSNSDLTKIRLRIRNRYLTNKNIDEICNEFKINLVLHYIDDETTYSNRNRKISCNHKRNIGVCKNEAEHNIEMNLYRKHYFLEEETCFSKYYIKNIEQEQEINYNKEIHSIENGIKNFRKSRTFCKSGDLIRILFKKNYFLPITYGHFMVLSTEFYKFQDKNDIDYTLEYDYKHCTKQIVQPKYKNNKDREIFFADFESDVNGDRHKPYMCVVQSEDGNISKTFVEGSCGKDLLDFLPDESITYFHNLAYDIRMFASFGIIESIMKGTRCLKAVVTWKDKTLYFKDSLALFNCKLSQLPSMFGLENVEKELFPYNYYNFHNFAEFERTIEEDDKEKIIYAGEIQEAGEYEIKPWNGKEYEQFEKNIDKIGARIDERYFDMFKYAEFYCKQDVRILRESFNVFRQGFKSDFNIDVVNFISISSLANEVFNHNVYYPNKNLFKVGGHVRHFLSKAVYGGRCMCAYNKKWYVEANICDYDAVSLYPSAMARLWTVEGRPNVISDSHLNLEFLSKQAAYIVEIKITAVHKHYPFPLIVQKINGLNVNCDEITEPITMVVDNIMLEDLINFQQIEFEFIKGYYWDGERDTRIQDEIKKIFQKRVEYKRQKNPLQQLYKLIMNSCYGKTIEKPVEKDIKYIRGFEDKEKYIRKNYNKIVEITEIRDSDIYGVKEIVPIDDHFNFSLLGIQVLSMSKRIMNEVMCLAYDIGCKIYYQDTDSMHIVKEDLEKLEKAFEDKYHRPLKGTNLGQFHTDFCSFDGREDVQHAVRSIFLMKKMYIDELRMSDNTYSFMFRGKGLTTKSILHLAKKKYGNNLMSLYNDLYEGFTLTFDLTKGQPCFRMDKDLSVVNIKDFKRKIKTDYEEGKDDEYFK